MNRFNIVVKTPQKDPFILKGNVFQGISFDKLKDAFKFLYENADLLIEHLSAEELIITTNAPKYHNKAPVKSPRLIVRILLWSKILKTDDLEFYY